MANLGTAYRLAYEAKNFRSGLTDVVAVISRPDGTIDGPYSCVEMLGVFTGVYAATYMSSLGYPEGEYLAAYVSPTENLRALSRFTLQKPPLLPSDIVIPSNTTIEAVLGGSAGTIDAILRKDDLYAEITGGSVEAVLSAESESISGIINQSGIRGELSDEL